MENLLSLSKFDAPVITIEEDAIITKGKLIDELKCYTDLTDDQVEVAAHCMKAAKELSKSVEDVRKELTAPLLAAQRDIKAKSDEFREEIDTEVKRVAGLLGVFEKKKREEEARLKREADEKLRLEQERIRKEGEEKLRLEKEKAQKLIDEAKEVGDKVAENQARLDIHSKNTEIQEEQKQEGIAAKAESQTNLALSKPEKTGVKLRDEWKFEVTDINKLQLLNPRLVKVEPNNMAIREAIKDCKDIPGLRIWNEPRAI